MNDPDYWQNLDKNGHVKVVPVDEEVRAYRRMSIGDRRLLLGETKQLMPWCTEAVDMYPCGEYEKTFQGDWMNLDGHWDTIMGDGAINLVGIELVEAVRPHCDRLVVRVFEEWIHEWKYATHFPTQFPGALTTYRIQEGTRMVIWDFKEADEWSRN